MCSFAMSIYSGDDVLKSFRNLLQGGDGTSAKKLDEDLGIPWACIKRWQCRSVKVVKR